jgi:Secretion system C-terminal sorting domain
MKKLYFTLAAVALVASVVYYSFDLYTKKNVKQQNDIVLESDITEENRQEELEARARQEFLMAVDPRLGYVPTERLIEGEERARQIMGSLGTNSPSVISALSWTERGPNNVGGRTRGFIFDQSDATGNTAFAGGVGGGLWRTTNFKTGAPVTWTQIASISPNLAITCIAQDPVVLTTLYAGTGEGYGNFDAIRGLGVYKSTDGGLTWSLLVPTTTGGTNANDFSYVQDIVVYNNATRDVYAACRSAIFCNAGGLMKSSNGGTTWTRVIGTFSGGTCANATDYKIYDIEISAGGDLWASSVTEATGLGKIWKSAAGATVGNAGTWADKTPTGTWQRIELACSPTNNDRVYALMQGATNAVGGIRRTDDGAAVPASSWTSINNATLWCDQGTSSSADFSRNQAWYDLILAVNPTNDATVFAGGVDVMRSTSSGGSWAQLTQWNTGCATLPYVHADIHNIVYLPGSSTEFVIATDGGLFYTADGGTTFSEKNTGYNVTQYYSCAIHPVAGSNFMLAGSQDNGTQRFTTAGMNTTTNASGGDGGFCFIDQKNPLQQITNFTGTSLNLSNNGGTSFTFPGSFATDRFINPADFDTATSTAPALSTTARYYCGGAAGNFRRVTINFSALSLVSNSFAVTGATTSRAVSAVKVDPNTPDRVWVAMSTASASSSVVPQLYYASSSSATPVFTAITLPVTITSGQYISSIDVENGDANHILITLSNYGVASVYESTDLGVTWTSLDNNGVNLPDVPVRWGMFIPSGFTQTPAAVGGILLATELGVWGTNTVSGTTTPWAANNTGMGNVRTDMIKLRGSDKTVAAATHGRGLFTSTLLSVVPVNFVWFKGNPLDNSNRLLWKVERSTDNRSFEVERKYEGENAFTNIGFVPAAAANGGNGEYSFDDRNVNVAKQTAIYRLKQVDTDGKFKYSDQLAIKRSQLGKLIYFVSADANTLFVRAGNKPGTSQVLLTIFDAQGKTVLSKTERYQDMRIDISRYASGAYVVKIKSINSGEEFVTRFVK